MIQRRALWGSLILAAFGTVLLLVYLRRFELETSGGPPVEVLTLVRAVERGQPLTEDMLATRRVPIAYVEERAVKATERAKVLGLPTVNILGPQHTLFWTDLAITSEERDLSRLVQPGKRAVTVPAAGVNDTRGNSLIRPGDYVDVIVTTVDQGAKADVAASVLLQRVLVLAVGERTSAGLDVAPSSRLGRNEKPLTLSLSLSEAQLLALALERGRLSVAVRNVEDPAIQDDIPDIPGSALLNPRARPSVPPRTPSAPGPVAIGGGNR